MDKFPLRVDIISDVVCPWCIIGFKRLEQALVKRELDNYMARLRSGEIRKFKN